MFRASAIAVITLVGCVSSPALAGQPPRPPSDLRIQDPRVLAPGRGFTAQPAGPVFELNVSSTSVFVGEPLTVTISPPDQVAVSPFAVAVDFGDGTTITNLPRSAQVAHRYTTPGTFTIFGRFTLRPGTTGTFDGPGPTIGNRVVVTVRAVTLAATPAMVMIKEAVTFATPVMVGESRMRLRYTFGDGEASPWIAESQATHAYAQAGTYQAVVEIGVLDDAGEAVPSSRSAPVTVQVVADAATPPAAPPAEPPVAPPPVTPPTDFATDDSSFEWLPYVLGALALLAVGYGAKRLFVPHPTLKAHPDPGEGEIDTSQGGLALELQVALRTDIDAMESTISADSAHLINEVAET